MATTQRTGLPEVWPSSITRLLSGDKTCFLEAWMKAHFRIEKRPQERPFNQAAWKVEHTALLSEVTQRYETAGWKVATEQYMRLKGSTAVLAFKPDIVARKEKRVRIVDVKTGEQKPEHLAQVAIYMIAVPLAWNAPMLADFIEGEVAYKDDLSIPVPIESVRPMRTNVMALMRKMGAEERPEAVPSQDNCRFCELIDADCPARWRDPNETVAETDQF